MWPIKTGDTIFGRTEVKRILGDRIFTEGKYLAGVIESLAKRIGRSKV